MPRFLPEEFSTRTGVTRERSARRGVVRAKRRTRDRGRRPKRASSSNPWNLRVVRRERVSERARRREEQPMKPKKLQKKQAQKTLKERRAEKAAREPGTLSRAFGDPASNGGAVGRTRT